MSLHKIVRTFEDNGWIISKVRPFLTAEFHHGSVHVLISTYDVTRDGVCRAILEKSRDIDATDRKSKNYKFRRRVLDDLMDALVLAWVG